MSYDKQTWVSGEVITATGLNHMEDGIENAGGGGGVFIVTKTWDDEASAYKLDKTYNQIKTALLAGQVILEFADESSESYGYTQYDYMTLKVIEENIPTDGSSPNYMVMFTNNDEYSANNADGVLAQQ